MTMPHERMRAIVWGAELLGALQVDPAVPEELQSEAGRIKASYPRTHELLELLKHPGQPFDGGIGQAVEEARTVFEQVQSLGVGSLDTRRSLLFTMRHFPLHGWARDAGRAASLGQLDAWLAPDPGW